MNRILMVASSPHIYDTTDTAQIMRDVILALLPAGAMAVYVFGLPALLLILTCVATCVASEYLFRRALGWDCTISDLSAVVTGLLLAYNLPPQLPLWMAAFGAVVAIVVVKQLFGGIGQNFANPAITARIILMTSFTQRMSQWLVPLREGAASTVSSASLQTVMETGAGRLVSSATPLAVVGGAPGLLPGYGDMLLGFRGGCIGETCSLALLLGGAYLLYRRVITATIPLAFVGTVLLGSLLLGRDPLYDLLSGGLLLGAIFMATDYATSPTNEGGRLVFGVGCGLITLLIRSFGSLPEGVSFAILLMNILSPHIEELMLPAPFGGERK